MKQSLLIIPLALSTSSLSWADTPNDTDDIERIEVKGSYIQGYNAHSASGASKLELPIIEIPQSVSVITNQQLQDFQLTDINAALDTATGINVERIETDRTYYTARGFDVTNFQIDGIGLPLASGNNHAGEDTAIYDRLEVIRGANGLMTGVGNPSATINFIRKRPTADDQLVVNGTYGSWNSGRVEVDGSKRFSDRFAARAVLVSEDKESYLDRYETDKQVAYIFLEGHLTDDTTVSLSHSYSNNNADGNLWGALPLYYTDGSATDYGRSTSTSADWSNWNVIRNNTVVELDHQLNDNWQIRSTYSYRKTDEDSELFYVFGTPDRDTELGLTGYASGYHHDDEHNLFDLYLSGDFELFDRDHQLVAGVNYAKLDYTDKSLYDYTTGAGFPAMPDLNEWDGNTPKPVFADGETGGDVTQEQKAAYVTGRFNLFDGFHAIVGGRYNDWDVDGESYDVVRDTGDTEFIPYLGVVYRVLPHVVAYASYTETFQSQTELDIDDKTLDPVTGESSEIGLKSEWFDGRLLASVAYFDIQQKNLAILDPSTENLPPDQQRYIGADGISSNGFELDVAGEIYEGLNVSIGYTDFDIDGDEQVAAYTPSRMFKFTAVYEVPFVEGLSTGMNMRWQDDISRSQGVVGDDFANAGDEIVTEQDAYAIVDLMARYNFNDDVSLSVNAYNVTDEKYLTSLYWAQGYYGAPANYSATLSWAF
ncbi:TonB-dependent siderophore receptor [Corallincola holothuriorum]|uniref:TonB-dependent siderophore receptor n=1 Tax=Corallincola holothuriorum TaxID=2282215 RepID=A0A368NIS7_9GAMM|nr:TonB-dependent siderophore receptor [Corallincola holothuriorum]RCU50066.1 TonB-dependent siderophore receptor [Corallincola holothuriorum]